MPGNFIIQTFNHATEAVPGQMTNTCWGTAGNRGDADYCGILVIDADTEDQLQGGVTDTRVPSGGNVEWTSEKGVPMPNKDLRCTCYIGYYVPAEQTIYVTDSRDFTIAKTGNGNGPIPEWMYWAGALAAIAVVGAAAYVVTKKK